MGPRCQSPNFFRLDPREKPPGVDHHDTMDPYDAWPPVCGDDHGILDVPGAAEEVASSGAATARAAAGSFGHLDFHASITLW